MVAPTLPGYYARFFQETRLLGSGSFGAVFLCRHVLDDMMLGDYAVTRSKVGWRVCGQAAGA